MQAKVAYKNWGSVFYLLHYNMLYFLSLFVLASEGNRSKSLHIANRWEWSHYWCWCFVSLYQTCIFSCRPVGYAMSVTVLYMRCNWKINIGLLHLGLFIQDAVTGYLPDFHLKLMHTVWLWLPSSLTLYPKTLRGGIGRPIEFWFSFMHSCNYWVRVFLAEIQMLLTNTTRCLEWFPLLKHSVHDVKFLLFAVFKICCMLNSMQTYQICCRAYCLWCTLKIQDFSAAIIHQGIGS